MADSKLVVYGHMEDARGTPEEGSTKFVISTVVKSHAILDGQKVLTIPRYMPTGDPKNPPKIDPDKKLMSPGNRPIPPQLGSKPTSLSVKPNWVLG